MLSGVTVMLALAPLALLLAHNARAAPISEDPRVTYVDCSTAIPASLKGTTRALPPSASSKRRAH